MATTTEKNETVESPSTVTRAHINFFAGYEQPTTKLGAEGFLTVFLAVLLIVGVILGEVTIKLNEDSFHRLSEENKESEQEIESKKAEIAPLIAQNETLSRIADDFKSFDKGLEGKEYLNLELINSVYDAVPENVTIKSISINKTSISIQASALLPDFAASYLYNLNKTGKFGEIKLPGFNSGSGSYDFTLDIPIKQKEKEDKENTDETGNSTENSTENTTENTTENSTEHTTENSTENPTNTTENPTNTTENTTHTTENPTNTTESPTENTTENKTENSTENKEKTNTDNKKENETERKEPTKTEHTEETSSGNHVDG